MTTPSPEALAQAREQPSEGNPHAFTNDEVQEAQDGLLADYPLEVLAEESPAMMRGIAMEQRALLNRERATVIELRRQLAEANEAGAHALAVGFEATEKRDAALRELATERQRAEAAEEDIEAIWRVANERYGDVGMEAYSAESAMRAVLDRAEETAREVSEAKRKALREALEARRRYFVGDSGRCTDCNGKAGPEGSPGWHPCDVCQEIAAIDAALAADGKDTP